jgi:hypothetical protein
MQIDPIDESEEIGFLRGGVREQIGNEADDRRMHYTYIHVIH